MSSPSLNAAASRLVPRGSRMLVLLVVVTVLIGLVIWRFHESVPLVSLLVPLLASSLVLGPRQLPWFVVFVLLVLALVVPSQDRIDLRIVLTVVIMFVLGFVVLASSLRRTRLGVAGIQGETMFVDLRDRILRQGGIPDLPAQWYAASELRSAGGTPFAGDFVVASRIAERLEVAVVDVSGKGQGAGTRALLLCGALGGLLSALPPSEFLDSANRFLLQQDWDEGFATAIHLSLDLTTGRYDIRSAGHPPAALRHAGSGRWEVLESEGPILGLIEDATFPAVSGVMRHGDALLLYTDGMVETRNRDIALGIDRMLGQAERLLRGQFEGGAKRLVEALGSRNDDRALLLVHRR
ncbi:PP2C family protein-serine/threonine phosphatase [Nocardioides sp. zg-1228]|uniref:PP2C family protein-serine/threonine phosphatase n=1 Tax=Nocardioides sp. zg-1228 TaxID=2763008 RepID=UPI001F11BF61|nr:PP2C family protein-serine/threonine phosphatase [Nocardioides sp. zg-1228]